ncbi:Acetyltransferase (GNAT) domain-containing protein [Candidatus Methylobacter favarea]|uniref:Acetyltransferase (GNAT) domain-containing protein n=1 Tax=Candidatus Methylobacter favarea TaxID=2707345 RepID=A0A8S0Y9K9_9GAMM|nr:GNAT family N-acetyltransferase [Candidatus Methylobacter favarea]CAA9890318.1 Acetyltransferase (GNAT) domain-containing protein [Candidatus Methylobacter favarea]
MTRACGEPIAMESALKAVQPSDENKRWRCRWVSEQDQDALLSLFSSAFGAPMQPSLWAWKYAGLAKQGVLAHCAGKVIAYYGGIPRTFWLQDEKLAAVQISDVMAVPEACGSLTRRGPFAHTAEIFLQSQIGPDKPYRFAFGFPTSRAARLGEKLGLYARGDAFFEAAWSMDTARRLPFWLKVQPLRSIVPAIIDGLWEDMKSSLPDIMLPQKDAEFFRWRYLEHPLNNYNLYLVSWRWINKPAGIFVLRDHGISLGLELMDFLGRPDAFNLMLQSAMYITRQLNRHRVFSWMTPHIISMLPPPSAKAEITGIYIDPPALKEMDGQLYKRLWFLSGDTDFR